MASDLEPIEVNHEEGKSFEKKIEFTKCSHSQIKYNRDKGELRCPCGVAFTGSRLSELEKLLRA